MYRAQSDDTSEDADRRQFEILRQMTSSQKAKLMTDLTMMAQRLAFAGLRERHPEATDDEIWLRLAARRLGRDVVLKVYGVDVDEG
jgi:hypothetical protein